MPQHPLGINSCLTNSLRNIMSSQKQALKFTNFSSEDFTYSFNSIPYTFKAGDSVIIFDYLAVHFGKHLVNRELQKEGVMNIFTDPKRKEMIIKCIQEVGIKENSYEEVQVAIGAYKAPKASKEEVKEEKKVEEKKVEKKEEEFKEINKRNAPTSSKKAKA